MATCNALTLTSSELLVTRPLLFAPSVDRTNRHLHTMSTASARTEQQDTVHIAKSVVLRAVEKIGQDQFTLQSLQQMRKHAKFAVLPSHLMSFMQMAVLRMVQKSTAADAKAVCLQKQSKNNQSGIYQRRKSGHQVQKTSFLAFLTTLQNANGILGLILIWSIFVNFMNSSKGGVLCLGLK